MLAVIQSSDQRRKCSGRDFRISLSSSCRCGLEGRVGRVQCQTVSNALEKSRENSDVSISTHLVLTLCGLTSPKTNQGGIGLSGSVHEEAHPCFHNFV